MRIKRKRRGWELSFPSLNVFIDLCFINDLKLLENVSERDKNDTIVLLDFKNLSKVVAYDVSLPRRLRLHRECILLTATAFL